MWRLLSVGIVVCLVVMAVVMVQAEVLGVSFMVV